MHGFASAYVQCVTGLSHSQGSTYAVCGEGRAQERTARAPTWRKAQAEAGLTLRRVKMYWRLPVIRGASAIWASAAESAATFRERLLPRRFGRACCPEPERLAAPVLLTPVPPPTPEYLAYVADLTPPATWQTLVAEDKDRATAWISDRWAYRTNGAASNASWGTALGRSRK